MRFKIFVLLISIPFISFLLTSCGDNCTGPNNPFPEFQYALEIPNVDGVFVHSTEWLNIVNNDAFDTFRIATRVVLFDQPGGAPITTGNVSVNGRPLSRSSGGMYSLNAEAGSIGTLNGPVTWQISGVTGHSDFTQEFAFKTSSFFNLDQEFSDIRTNSEFFITIDRGINGDDAYIFLCGSKGCVSNQVSVNNPGDHYDLSEFETTGIGNGLMQGTSRLVEIVNIGSKSYAVIFQTSAAYHTEIIEGNEPKCED